MTQWMVAYPGGSMGPLSTEEVRALARAGRLPPNATAAPIGGGAARALYAWPDFADVAAPPPVVAQPVYYAPQPQRDVGTFALTRNCLGCIIAAVAMNVLFVLVLLIIGALGR